MRVRTLEIRWHDNKPISTCDFQPVPFKVARPVHDEDLTNQAYRLATGGEDNNVRLWMVHPHILPPSVAESASTSSVPVVPHPPRVEYLATLMRHSAPVNVVRFSPSGELIASAGDDGMVIIWAPSNTAHHTYGMEQSAEELQYEKEFWKPRTIFRCTTMQVYDLAWSPNGEYIIAGSTDNTARVFNASDGHCVQEIAEHSHYVQGVAWDPLNEYIATQSSDRSVHVYSISTKQGVFEAHAVGKNTRINIRNSRTPSVGTRPTSRMMRRQSIASDAESSITAASDGTGREKEKEKEREYKLKEDSTPHSAPGVPLASSSNVLATPLTPATSVASTPSAAVFLPPPPERPLSRRSSFSSNAPGSPPSLSHHPLNRYGRSPSPMPPLPAIRAPPAATVLSARLYGDESFTNFFRRLTFSPDGGLLLTPAGHFEDPFIIPSQTHSRSSSSVGAEGGRGRKGHPSDVSNEKDKEQETSNSSSVLIYTRANFTRPPIGQLPGHKKPSVAVKFSPILYELRPGVGAGIASTLASGNSGAQVSSGKEGSDSSNKTTSSSVPPTEPARVAVERGTEEVVNVNVAGPVNPPGAAIGSEDITMRAPTPSTPIAGSAAMLPSPAPSTMELRPATPAATATATSATPSATPTSNSKAESGSVAVGSTTTTSSMFSLPYRMLFAVATMDTITVYDTQQSTPICLLTKLHYDEFTDMAWSPDGQCLMLTSRDGYCTIAIFDEPLTPHHTQQYALQLQNIAHVHGQVSYTGHGHGHGHGRAHSQSQSHSHQRSATPHSAPATSAGVGASVSTNSGAGAIVGGSSNISTISAPIAVHTQGYHFPGPPSSSSSTLPSPSIWPSSIPPLPTSTSSTPSITPFRKESSVPFSSQVSVSTSIVQGQTQTQMATPAASGDESSVSGHNSLGLGRSNPSEAIEIRKRKSGAGDESDSSAGVGVGGSVGAALDDLAGETAEAAGSGPATVEGGEPVLTAPPKKKRRVALTHLGGLEP